MVTRWNVWFGIWWISNVEYVNGSLHAIFSLASLIISIEIFTLASIITVQYKQGAFLFYFPLDPLNVRSTMWTAILSYESLWNVSVNTMLLYNDILWSWNHVLMSSFLLWFRKSIINKLLKNDIPTFPAIFVYHNMSISL